MAMSTELNSGKPPTESRENELLLPNWALLRLRVIRDPSSAEMEEDAAAAAAAVVAAFAMEPGLWRARGASLASAGSCLRPRGVHPLTLATATVRAAAAAVAFGRATATALAAAGLATAGLVAALPPNPTGRTGMLKPPPPPPGGRVVLWWSPLDDLSGPRRETGTFSERRCGRDLSQERVLVHAPCPLLLRLALHEQRLFVLLCAQLDRRND